jgi:hypothetical protein
MEHLLAGWKRRGEHSMCPGVASRRACATRRESPLGTIDQEWALPQLVTSPRFGPDSVFAIRRRQLEPGATMSDNQQQGQGNDASSSDRSGQGQRGQDSEQQGQSGQQGQQGGSQGSPGGAGQGQSGSQQSQTGRSGQQGGGSQQSQSGRSDQQGSDGNLDEDDLGDSSRASSIRQGSDNSNRGASGQQSR